MSQPQVMSRHAGARRLASGIVGKGKTAYQRIRHDPEQVERYESPGGSAPNVLMIGPAEMPIPAIGWGAVETVISEQIPALVQHGFTVTLLNSRRRRLWLQALEGADIVLCHYDALAQRAINEARRRRIPCMVATHYGYAAFPDKWESGYQAIFGGMLTADAVACLSPAILQTFEQLGFGERARLTPNGSNFTCRGGDHKQGAVVIGKVEPRKGQFELAVAAISAGIPLALVGPMFDQRVHDLLLRNPTGPVRWLGSWSRGKLEARLGDFTRLLLPSRGEADALVLYEAQLAGLEIYVSDAGLGAQQPHLPWIHVVGEGLTAQNYLEAISDCTPHRSIADYALQRYPWRYRIDPWVEALSGLL